jgi:hypothetical protein
MSRARVIALGIVAVVASAGAAPVHPERLNEKSRLYKFYRDSTNPKTHFCAVLTCSPADKQCPIVEGASQRISLPFDDPKDFDGSPQESAKYDERCQQIARELLFLFSEVNARASA